jgi:class 3 adenylate cyclase/tetratricopeptide (TPR) repeat protein
VPLAAGRRQRPDLRDQAEERKVVTVLFADLAGSTALGHGLDPEEVRDVQRDLYGLVARCVEAHGGVMEKFAGDAALAVFGAPRAHADDAERAVRAAFAMRDDFVALARRVRERHGADVGLRIGVNTGEVVTSRQSVARGDLMVSGDAVNVAARLQSAAERGEIVAGERTVLACALAVEFGPARTLPAKGKPDGVIARPALGLRDRAEALGETGLAAPLIGRDDELELLRTLAGRGLRERIPQLVTIFGEPGIGKSRLLAELAKAIPGARVRVGRCLSYGESLAYWPLGEIAKQFSGVLENDGAAAARAKHETALADLLGPDDGRRALAAIGDAMGLDATDPRVSGRHAEDAAEAIAEAFVSFLGALGRREPTVIAIEDVHWAAPALLDVLERLVASLRDSMLVLVCTARHELLDVRPTWGAGLRNATALDLRALPAGPAAQLVGALLAGAELPSDLRERILARAEGNPFYTEEILRSLIEQGALVRSNGRFRAGEHLGAVTLPDTVRGVIAERIDRLDAREREALRACAVVGRAFWADAVDADPATLERLRQRELVLERPGSSVAGMVEYEFKHALTREVAYEALPRPARRDLHRHVAEWIGRLAPDREGEMADLAAHHYAQALAYGETRPTVRAQARETLVRAADGALRRGDTAAALASLSVAEPLAEELAQRARIVRTVAECELWEGRIEESIGTFERARAAYRELGEPEVEAELLAWLSRAYWLVVRPAEALEAANTAVELLRCAPQNSPRCAYVLARRAQLEMLAGFAEAVPHSQRALEVARAAGDAFSEANALINLGTSLVNEGHADATGMVLEAVPLALRVGAFEEALRAVVNFIWTATSALPLPEVEAAVETAVDAVGPVVGFAAIRTYLDASRRYLLALPMGRLDEARRPGGLRLGPGGDPGTGRIVWDQIAIRVDLARGRNAEAQRRLARMLPLATTSGEPQRIVPARILAALASAAEGDAAATWTHLEAALASTAGMTCAGLLCDIALDAPLALLRAGALDAGPALAAALEARLAPIALLLAETGRAALDAVVALGAGRPRDAVASFERARDLEAARGATLHVARYDLAVAAAAEAAGDRDAAAAARERARRVLEPIGCVLEP